MDSFGPSVDLIKRSSDFSDSCHEAGVHRVVLFHHEKAVSFWPAGIRKWTEIVELNICRYEIRVSPFIHEKDVKKRVVVVQNFI